MFARTTQNKTGYNTHKNKENKIASQQERTNGLTSKCYLLAEIVCAMLRGVVSTAAQWFAVISQKKTYVITYRVACSRVCNCRHKSCVCFVVIAVCFCTLALSCWIFTLTASGYLINKQWARASARLRLPTRIRLDSGPKISVCPCRWLSHSLIFVLPMCGKKRNKRERERACLPGHGGILNKSSEMFCGGCSFLLTSRARVAVKWQMTFITLAQLSLRFVELGSLPGNGDNMQRVLYCAGCA